MEQCCKKYTDSITQRLGTVEAKLADKADKESVDDIKTQSMINASAIKDLQQDICTLKDNFDLLQGEAEEIAKRKANIMIKGLPASEDDQDSVSKLLSSLGVSEKPTYVRRVGTEPDSPLKVFFKQEKTRNFVLSKATSLCKNHAYNGVYVVPDLTKLQRDRDYRLREKLRDLKAKQPNKHFIIRNGQIKETTQDDPTSRAKVPSPNQHTPVVGRVGSPALSNAQNKGNARRTPPPSWLTNCPIQSTTSRPSSSVSRSQQSRSLARVKPSS